MIKRSDIQKFVRQTAREMKKEFQDHNEWVDRTFEEVDNWWSSQIGTGRISELPPVPESYTDVQHLQDAITVLQTAMHENWGIADDSGLWEGMHPYPALLTQAFYTLEQALGQQEPQSLY